MIMGRIWAALAAVSILCSLQTHTGGALAGAVISGAQAGVELAVAMAGSLCLWSGMGAVMEAAGLTRQLSRLLRPLLGRLYPSSRTDPILAGHLSANFCANLLGLGNAATPMGIQAARGLKRGSAASDELCRLVVLNTASVQLIPTTVAALRASAGCRTPFDILPAVWLTSALSAGLGLCAAYLLGKRRRP